MNKSIDIRRERFPRTALFSSLKLGILIFYFHQAVGKVYIIDDTVFCRVSESLDFPALLFSQCCTLKRALGRESSMIPGCKNNGRID